MSRAADESISTAYIQSLQEQIFLLRKIVKAAGAILSDDDDFDTLRRRYDTGGRQAYREACAEYFRVTGRSA